MRSSQPDELHRRTLRQEPAAALHAAARGRGDARADAHDHDDHGAGRNVRGSIDLRDGLLQAQVQGLQPLKLAAARDLAAAKVDAARAARALALAADARLGGDVM